MDFNNNDFDSNILNSYKINEKITTTIIPTFESVYFETSGFGVYIVQDEKDNEYFIKGVFVSNLVIGQTYRAEGKVILYKGERQLDVSNIKNVQPINKKGIISYLQTLRGLKSKADLIYDQFGDKSIQILIDNPMEVANSIYGIGEKSVMSWQEQLNKMQDSQFVITRLLGYGLSPNQAKVLYDEYKDSVIDKIESNPYFLSYEVKGYGFLKCDKIARNVGFNPESSYRIEEGIIHILTEATKSGHCYLPEEELIEKVIELLSIKLSFQEMTEFSFKIQDQETFEYSIGKYKYNINYLSMRQMLDVCRNTNNAKSREKYRYTVVSISKETVLESIKILKLEDRVISEKDFIYLREIHKDEADVAFNILSLMRETPFEMPFNLEEKLESHLNNSKIKLEEMQEKAVLEISKNKGGFFILSGQAGTGKTFILKIILQMLEIQYITNDLEFEVKIMAPTGKASKVAAKATKLPCTTIHRGLQYNPQGGFIHDQNNPLYADCVVIDEASMLDITLASKLLCAIKKGTKVIFMGDVHQLPSIGPGNVLRDMINSNLVKTITLNVIKRQNELSGIIRNATHIVNSEPIENCNDTKDAYVLIRNTPEGAQKAIIDSFNRILDIGKFNFDEVQLLCPQKNGPIGTYYMNYLLQHTFNRNHSEYVVLNRKFEINLGYNKRPEVVELYFKRGDKVIHIKNNYDMLWYEKVFNNQYVIKNDLLGLTNGECGTIADIIKVRIDNELKTRIIVKYEDGYVFYDDGPDELNHAYALTIHKSQGSQWPAVIIPLMKQNLMMLDNNLFYTAYTRAESFSVVVSQIDAMEYAINNHRIRHRYTNLENKLK